VPNLGAGRQDGPEMSGLPHISDENQQRPWSVLIDFFRKFSYSHFSQTGSLSNFRPDCQILSERDTLSGSIRARRYARKFSIGSPFSGGLENSRHLECGPNTTATLHLPPTILRSRAGSLAPFREHEADRTRIVRFVTRMSLIWKMVLPKYILCMFDSRIHTRSG
jgi:hypothetical protein